ncbi:DUF6069 family protein [Streptomyces sp. NBC_00841]|uniref:DUF6069 family protein n=1 Tax=unclassified Streptomyces TaxID=2593676 RepID=UPI00225A4EE3|nr:MULTISPECIES: DUF6069 family protein [unclassified Streptomyces]MCX4531944.1 DUF6069 family protein [Streptomyces sp. NBC_01669]WSA02528.1 DUF6069 family protein [Streptomyces sp. NBC_00841]
MDAWNSQNSYGQPQQRTGYLRPKPPRLRVDAARLWAGGAMTAVVAALTAVVGVLLVRGVLDVPLFAPESAGAMGDASTGLLAAGAALAALAGTALLHLLIVATSQPGPFFVCIVVLATAVMVLLPFTTSVPVDAKIGSAAVCLAVGTAIGFLLSAAGRSSVRRSPY